MKKKEALELFYSLDKLDDLKGEKLAYAVVKNKKSLKRIVEDLQHAASPSKEWAELQTKHTKNGRFNEAAAKKDNPKEFKARVKQVESYKELLEEEAEIGMHKIKEKYIPKEVTVKQYEILSNFL
jgi:hypothetical protein